jgi:hypothetical protein
MVTATGLHVRVGDWLCSDPSKIGLREIKATGLRWDRDSQTLAVRIDFNPVKGQPDKRLELAALIAVIVNALAGLFRV